MDDLATPQVVRTYLAQLESALHDVPADVGHDIVAGVSEELDGLSAADAAVRIEALGDPMFIASEARSSAGIAPDAAPDAVPSAGGARGTVPSMPGSAIVIVLLIVMGGYVVPFVGWAVGILLLWASPIWNDRDKWAGTLYGPVAGVAGGLLIAMLTSLFNLGGFGGLLSWNMVFIGFLVLPFLANVAVGFRLLRAAQRRG